MKSDRLFNIIYILIDRKEITAKELAEKLEVSTRTIYRDIDTLSMAGLPIYTDKGTGGGIKIHDDFVFNKSLISSDEKNDIMLALDMLRATEYKNVSETLGKLGILFNSKDTDYIDIDFSSYYNYFEKEIFDKIKDAVRSSRVLIIEYKPYEKEPSTREIIPLKLVFKKYTWYLVAYCRLREDFRTFRISRVVNIGLSKETFNRNNYDITDYVLKFKEKDNDNKLKIELKLNKKALYMIEEEFRDDYLLDEDDNIVVTFDAKNDKHLYRYLLMYIDSIINIKPDIIKQTLKEKVKKLLEIWHTVVILDLI